MTTRAQEKAIFELSEKWGVDISPWVADSLKGQEGLLHEICHAIVLQSRVDDGCQFRTADRFDELNDDSKIFGLVYEIKTFAVQHHALRYLKWQRRIPLQRLLKDVWVNGMSGPALPWEVTKLLFRRFVREDTSKEMGYTAARKIISLSEKFLSPQGDTERK